MIHYHGTPITPKSALASMSGENFCVSFFRPDSLRVCQQIGQSLMLDNGAYSSRTLGVPFDLDGFYRWLDPILAHPHWGVVPDVIDGTEDDQRALVKTWPFGERFGIPVWHLGLSIGYLMELCDKWGRVCLGSSRQFWQVGSPEWRQRMDEVFNALHRTYGARLPWTHGMRMLGQGTERWPLSSADSTNVAVSHSQRPECAGCMAKRINAQNPKTTWSPQLIQQGLL